ncbi:TPA: hypothetical protein DHW58_02405 [Patescibacteria group bacterium]|uniref:Uncharacterized protein n=2 Tax=Bacteria division Kazan-3B-28 TaxID=1798534 RepID=A0A0G1X6R1_UNCK3|nr:MAG: hypothetical protein VE98_C0001G0182 [candidate division Kazan bacterium GW2011_GWA1_50_15]KKW25542.1 MAG: hypothetical protein VE99_C0001G0179 [candidate division Kazan bacterium GW2011_GWC1_52_13]KKW26848.1 MAG: hypothetical protein VF00_C0002G0173 [candidate division Kazan bacterium GW2011_GWB1_52_7]HAV65841.1 hypothetical protein [Patescibacteria group bacterium]HCL47821.1 hypothetical protein [Patescibacteria group bacterium]
MPRRSKKKFWAEVNARRSARWSRIGREFEGEVLELLKAAQENDTPIFTNVIHHTPYSGADYAGKDFTVTRYVDGHTEHRSFGITISKHKIQDAQMLHPGVPQFHFPIGTKPETIVARVKALFNDPSPPETPS